MATCKYGKRFVQNQNQKHEKDVNIVNTARECQIVNVLVSLRHAKME
jgi:hypothetical protein